MGKSETADDNIIAQATCEAVVQRLPEYVDRPTITTIHGMMIPRPLHSTPSTRPTAAVLKFRASDGWIKAKYNFTFMSSLRSTSATGMSYRPLSCSLTCAQEPQRAAAIAAKQNPTRARLLPRSRFLRFLMRISITATEPSSSRSLEKRQKVNPLPALKGQGSRVIHRP